MSVSQVYTIPWGVGIVFVTLIHSNLGLLSDYKICGDPECESLMSRVQAIRDHHGEDCRFLSFRRGETIFVYHKLTGKREDLWAGSIDKQFGYFPKDAVREEQVYATMERAVETQKSDFFCMDEFGYPIDSSHLDSDDDDDDQDIQNQESETSQTTPYTDETNTESPSISTESPVSAQEADGTLTTEEENKNDSDNAAGTHKEPQETPGALNEQGGSAPSSGFGSSVTGWLGLTKEEEVVAEGEKKVEGKEMQAEASVASSVTGWLGLGGEVTPDDAVKSRETDDSFASTMTGWFGFGGEKKTDPSTEKEQEEEGEDDVEPAETFRSRRMSLDLEGSQLHEEEKKEMGTLGWLGNGLSSTLRFGLTNQESGHEKTPEREVKETIQEEEGQPASGSWLDMGIGDILGFRKDIERHESTGSGFKETEEDKTLEEPTGSENVDTSQSQPALTEEVRTETVDKTPEDQNADSHNSDIGTSDSSKDSVLPEDTASKVHLNDISQAVGGMSSMLNSSKEEEEANVSDDQKQEKNVLDEGRSAEIEGQDHQMPETAENQGEDNRGPGEDRIITESYTDQDFVTRSDINLVPDLSSVGEVEEDKTKDVGVGEVEEDKTENKDVGQVEEDRTKDVDVGEVEEDKTKDVGVGEVEEDKTENKDVGQVEEDRTKDVDGGEVEDKTEDVDVGEVEEDRTKDVGEVEEDRAEDVGEVEEDRAEDVDVGEVEEDRAEDVGEVEEDRAEDVDVGEVEEDRAEDVGEVEEVRAEDVGEVEEDRAEDVGEVEEVRAEDVGEVEEVRAEDVGEVEEDRAEDVGEVEEVRAEDVGEVEEDRAEDVGEVEEDRAEDVGEVEEDKTEDVIEEGAQISNQINYTEESTHASVATGASSDDGEGEGNNAGTDVLRREISTTETDDSAGESGGKSQPTLSSDAGEERNEPISSEDDTLPTNVDHSGSLSMVDDNTETETQQRQLGQQGEGSSQELGPSHSTNKGTETLASEEDRRTLSTSESTTQTENNADQDSAVSQQGATHSDGDAHMLKETVTENEKDSDKNNLQPVQTETMGSEKYILSESGLKSDIGSETETEEVEESRDEEKQGMIEELKEEDKQEEVEEIKEEGKQQEVKEIKEEGKQQEVKEIKEERKQEEVVKLEDEGKQEDVKEVEEIKAQEKLQEVEEEKQDEVEELKEEEKQQELKEIEEEEVGELKEEKKQAVEELKEKRKQEEVEEITEEDNQEEEGKLTEEEKQGKGEELKEDEKKEDKMQELKEEIKDEMEEIQEELNIEEIKDEMEEIQEELNIEEIKDEMEEIQEELKEELKGDQMDVIKEEKQQQEELKEEEKKSEMSTQKSQTENPQMEEEEGEEEKKNQEEVEEVKDEMKQEVENVEGEKRNKEEEGSLNKCSNELYPQAGEEGLLRDREGNDSTDRLRSIDEGIGKQNPVVDNDQILVERTEEGQREPVEGMEGDEDGIQEEGKDEGGTEGGMEVSGDPVESQAVVSEQTVGHNIGTAQTGSRGTFGLFKNAFSFFRSPITQTETSTEPAPSLDPTTGETSKTSLPPEQELDPTTDSRQVYVQDLHTDSPVTMSQQQPPFTDTQTSSPSPTQIHSDTKHPTKHYKNLLTHMSAYETDVLTELFGRHKLQFLDYMLGSSESTPHDPDNDESILLDIERLMHYHRETLVAPSMRLSDAPQEDKEKTRALVALQKLEMLLARVRETFSTAEASCVGASCSIHSEDEGTATEEDSSVGLENITPRDEWMGEDKEKDRVTEDERKGEKGKRSEEEEERASPESHPHIQPGSPRPLEGVIKPILDFVHQIAEELTPHVHAVRELLIWITVQVVSSLPDDIRPGPDLYGVPWEPVIFSSVLGLVTVLLFTCRCYSSVKSRMYRGKERWMAEQVAQLLDEKCKVLETLSKCQQEYDELENSLRDSGVLAQTQKTEQLEVKARQLGHAKRELDRDLEQLKDQLEQQREHRIEQERRIAVLEESMKTFEEETKDLQSQEEQAQTTLKVYNMNCDRLQRNLETAGEENAVLHESNAHLRQQVEGWAERVSELEAEMSRYEIAHSGMMQDVANKDERIMSLTDRLLRMKAWDSDLEDEGGEEGGGKETSNGTAGKGEANGREDIMDTQGHLQKVQKLIYAAKLNADLKSVDEDKDRLFSKLNNEVKAKEDLQESIKELDNEKLSLQSDTEQYAEQVQRLQQKLQIMTEMYQENELKLHRLLTVEEKERMQKEEKLNKADKNIAMAMEELGNYRQRAGEMEDELEKTKQSYQTQISAHEKKAHNNWLAARAAERELADIRRENALFRQKLTDTQFKLDALDKDPYALDSLARPLPFRAERSPYGPSPLGRPSSETRAFLSPPTLMDGPPARLSPRVSRGPMEPPGGQGELERSGGPHSDSGSISPTWERDRRGPPPGPPGPLGPPGYMFPEPGGPMYRRPPPGALGHLPPPGSLPPGPLHPRGLPPGPPHPADMADGPYRENHLGPSEQELRESGPGDRRTPPEADPRMGGAPPMGPMGPMGPMDGPFPRRAPYGPPPPDFYPPRGPGGPPRMPMWAPPPPGMMFPPRFPPGGPPLPPHYTPPMRPPLPDGHPHPPMGPPQQSHPFPPRSQTPEEHTPSPEDAI